MCSGVGVGVQTRRIHKYFTRPAMGIQHDVVISVGEQARHMRASEQANERTVGLKWLNGLKSRSRGMPRKWREVLISCDRNWRFRERFHSFQEPVNSEVEARLTSRRRRNFLHFHLYTRLFHRLKVYAFLHQAVFTIKTLSATYILSLKSLDT